MNTELKIEIRPIPDNNGIRQFSQELEYFSSGHTIGPFVDPQTLKYSHGLSEEDFEYLKKEGIAYDLSDNWIKGVWHPFWESSLVKVDLKSNPMFLFPYKSVIDFIKWKYLLVNEYVYASEAQMKTGSKSEATHYIYDESVSHDLKAGVLEKRNELISKVSKLSLAKKRELILIMFNENTDNKDESYLTLRFEDIFNDKNDSRKLSSFLEETKEKLSLRALIKSAILKAVLKRTAQGIFFFDNNIGFSEDDVIEFLSKDENQTLLVNIKSKIE